MGSTAFSPVDALLPDHLQSVGNYSVDPDGLDELGMATTDIVAMEWMDGLADEWDHTQRSHRFLVFST